MIDDRPAERIVQGSPGERDALIRASQTRRLTDKERMRLASLTWTPDSTLERVRLIRDRHPDLLEHFKVHPAALDAYERDRNTAIEGGRHVPEPDKETVAALDKAAKYLRAVMAEPVPNIKDINRRGRSAFAAAFADHGALVAAWEAWKAELRSVDERARRVAEARGALGLPSAYNNVELPQWSREMDQAAGGSIPWAGVGSPGLMV
jgi:hypothetical protein